MRSMSKVLTWLGLKKEGRDLDDVRVAIAFKNFAPWSGMSHVGLNVAALTNARVLRQNGIHTAVFPVRHNVDLVQSIEEYNNEHARPLTHVIISAPWLTRYEMKELIEGYPNIKFVIESHSNVGFLQADPGALELIRAAIDLSRTYDNLFVGGNSKRFTDWLKVVYDYPAVLLPNLYPLGEFENGFWDGSTPIKIGAFGAVRPQKNFMTAAGAAVAICKILDMPVEFHMITGGEGDGGAVARAIDQMVKDVPDFKLIRHQWRPWEEFILLIEDMDLMIQASYTESFNMVTADGIVVGVPSVVSSAIIWAPEEWRADVDDALNVAERGIQILKDTNAVREGYKALVENNLRSLPSWFKFLEK